MNLKIEYVPVDAIRPYENNAKMHPEEQVEQIKKSIQEFGFNDPIAVWNDEIVEGHGRLMAAKELGVDTIPIIRLDDLTDEQRRAYMLVHNKLTMNSDYDLNILDIELDNIADIDMSVFGFELDLGGGYTADEEKKGSLAEKYLVAPFSVIYANKPDWLKRKRAWVARGIRSEIGRGGDLLSMQGARTRQQSYKGTDRSKAYADGLIERREAIRRGTYGRSV